jgi:hypothetical protein
MLSARDSCVGTDERTFMSRTQGELVNGPEQVALAPIEYESFMPALSIQQAVERFNAVVEFVRTVMREGVDYGRIPGTDKPTLLKPGAEKLCTLFGLTSRFQLIRAIEDWTGGEHNGEPFFYYLYRCQLWRGDRIIAEGDGSCNSFEQKYRYREAQRKCPVCGLAAIIRGKEEYGGGWLCFKKRGGCGTKFRADDPEIVDQQTGRVLNETIADQVNTIQKMAQKRAIIAATLLAVNGSEFFTQDSEDRLVAPGAAEDTAAARPPQRLRRDLMEECANLCRALKAGGHADFKDRDSIIKHLRRTAEAKGWKTAPESHQIKALSDLPDELLAEYGTVLAGELESLGRDQY